jgi:hypothetical protein
MSGAASRARTLGGPVSGAWRVLRGLCVGGTAFGIAIGGHVAGGGQAPPFLPTVALALAFGAGCVWLSDLRWTTPRLFTVLAMAQVAFHAILMLLTPAGMPGMHGAGLSRSMFAGHAAAVLVTTLVLRHGEGWVWRVAKLLTRWLPRIPVRIGLRPLTVVVARRHDPASTRRGLLLAEACARRGPPRALAS